MRGKKQLIAEAKVYSEFLIGLAIAWTAGGIASPFISGDTSLKGFIPFFLGCASSLLCLRYAVKYQKKI